MITLACIHCDSFIELVPYAGPGLMSKHKCNECGKESWLRHSNIDPTSYTEDMVVVNDEKKSIKIKDAFN